MSRAALPKIARLLLLPSPPVRRLLAGPVWPPPLPPSTPVRSPSRPATVILSPSPPSTPSSGRSSPASGPTTSPPTSAPPASSDEASPEGASLEAQFDAAFGPLRWDIDEEEDSSAPTGAPAASPLVSLDAQLDAAFGSLWDDDEEEEYVASPSASPAATTADEAALPPPAQERWWYEQCWSEGCATFCPGFDPRYVVDTADDSVLGSPAPIPYHHFNRWGMPVPYHTSTPAEVSIWAAGAMTRKAEAARAGTRRSLVSGSLRVALLEHLASLTVDPVMAVSGWTPYSTGEAVEEVGDFEEY